MGADERVYYDPERAAGLRRRLWGAAIGVLDWANGQAYGRLRGGLWARWHAAYLAETRGR